MKNGKYTFIISFLLFLQHICHTRFCVIWRIFQTYLFQRILKMEKTVLKWLKVEKRKQGNIHVIVTCMWHKREDFQKFRRVVKKSLTETLVVMTLNYRCWITQPRTGSIYPRKFLCVPHKVNSSPCHYCEWMSIW